MLNVLLRPIEAINSAILKICNGVAITAIAAMVLAILVQVFFRYIIGNALPWPDEFARFCMLWMTGLMAPLAYRQGGFVAIDMLGEVLGRRAAAVLSLFLLAISLLVLVFGIKLGLKHVNSGWLFASSSLKIPLSIVGMQSVKLKLAYMYSSLWIGLILLTCINVELILKSFQSLFHGDKDDPNTPSDSVQHTVGTD